LFLLRGGQLQEKSLDYGQGHTNHNHGADPRGCNLMPTTQIGPPLWVKINFADFYSEFCIRCMLIRKLVFLLDKAKKPK